VSERARARASERANERERARARERERESLRANTKKKTYATIVLCITEMYLVTYYVLPNNRSVLADTFLFH